MSAVSDDLVNLRNLTSLWMALGAQRHRLPSGTVLNRSLGWPHRLWFDPGVTPAPDDARALVAAARAAASEVVIPDWGPRSEALGPVLSESGFAVAFEQTLMSLRPAPFRDSPARLAGPVRLDGAERELTTWAHAASSAFGYRVDPTSVERLLGHEGARLVLARVGDAVVGTGLLFEADGVAGLHMVGVVPDARRAGFARHIMRGLLSLHRSPLVTLQASAMGEPLYRQLGFTGGTCFRNHMLVAS